MRRSRRVLASALLGLLVGLLTTILLVVPVGVAFVSGGKAPSDQPTYVYDAPPTATTPTAKMRNDAARGERSTATRSRSSTSRITARRAAKGEEGLRWVWKTRPRPGADGGVSKIGVERAGDDAISQVHGVTVDGKLVHQHQTHIGKYGGQRQFPDDWVQFPSVGSP